MINKNKKKKDFKFRFDFNLGRFSVLYAVVLFFGLMMMGRLYVLQVVAHEKYREMAENQHILSREIEARRGEIFLNDEKEKYPLAVNRQLQMAYVVPKEVEEKDRLISEVSSVLDLNKEAVAEKLSDSEDMFEILKHKLSEEEVDRIVNLKIKGLKLLPEIFRFYPGQELAAHVVGFVGSDGKRDQGRYGIEAFFEKDLEGFKGEIIQERDTRGGWISVGKREERPALDGKDFILTISYPVQFEAEKILRETVEKHKADGGSIIVLEVKTGKILAMANAPVFNPNEFGKVDEAGLFMNSSVSSVYECGSIFKPITMAIGIDGGKVSSTTTYNDSGVVFEAGYEIHNSDNKANGTQTMTQVLEKSLNTGVIFVEKQVGNKIFSEYVKNFGFGQKTGIELPGEVAGNINNLRDLRSNIQFFTASFGQGISMTPLQIVNAYSAIANGGMLMKPQIIEKIIHSEDQVENIEPQEIRRVVKEETAKEIGLMLRNVVVSGHGKKADVPGYLVGGKTGTAQVPKKGGGGYEDGLTIGSFAGFAPINDPQFAVLVKIDNPKDVIWAESTAAPAFSRIMKFLLEYKKIKPTEEFSADKLEKFYSDQIVSVPENQSVVLKIEEKDKKQDKKKKD